MSFDARKVKLLNPDEYIGYPDYPGLRIVASTRGHSWIYRYKNATGAMRQTKLGVWPVMSFGAAVHEWEQKRNLRQAGGDPAADKKRAKAAQIAEQQELQEKAVAAKLTVRDLCEAYYTGHICKKRKKKGQEAVRSFFDRLLGDVATMPVSKVTRAVAFNLIQDNMEFPRQAKCFKQELAAAWEYGHDAGLLSEDVPNWWRQILRNKIKSTGKKIGGVSIGTTKRVLSERELRVLLPWLPNFSRVISDILTLYLWTGARGCEICAMSVHELTQEDGILWWTIPKAKTKNARFENAVDLRVPLFGRAAEIVKRRQAIAKNEWLFPAQGKARGRHKEQKAVQEAVYCHQPYSQIQSYQYPNRLPVSHWSPHDLRRTARTLLASIGCEYNVGEAVLGHMPSGIGGTYDRHTYDNQRVEWLAKLAAKLEELAVSP